MCEKCAELDSKIAHYRQIALNFADQRTLDGIEVLIKKITADKAALRCGLEKQ